MMVYKEKMGDIRKRGDKDGNLTWEPQNHPIEKENNLTNNSMTLGIQLFVFQGVQGGAPTNCK